LAEEFDVAAIFLPTGAALHAPEEFGTREWNRHAVDFMDFEVFGKALPCVAKNIKNADIIY